MPLGLREPFLDFSGKTGSAYEDHGEWVGGDRAGQDAWGFRATRG